MRDAGHDSSQDAKESIRIVEEADIITARQRVRATAQELGFDSFAASAIITITSELARNIWVYAGRGEVVVERIDKGARKGIGLQFIDQGPGIVDLPKVLKGGLSRGGGLGLGLSGSKRLADEFDIDTQPGKGTHISVVKWKAR